MATPLAEILQAPEHEWTPFPGGELEGRRRRQPRQLCPTCREAPRRAATGPTKAPDHRRPLCFQCYRLELERDRALKAAGELDTASVARFQEALPFDAVDTPRLKMMKVERLVVRTLAKAGAGQFVDRRRQAQIAARHALQAIAEGLKRRRAAEAERDRAMAAAIHAAELQLPESWLPFVTQLAR
jgi:hypothetical protein